PGPALRWQGRATPRLRGGYRPYRQSPGSAAPCPARPGDGCEGSPRAPRAFAAARAASLRPVPDRARPAATSPDLIAAAAGSAATGPPVAGKFGIRSMLTCRYPEAVGLKSELDVGAQQRFRHARKDPTLAGEGLPPVHR